MGAVNVHRLWPSLGSVHGGTLITMMGDDLGRASAAGLKCLFDKVAVSEVKAISSSSLACTSPRRWSWTSAEQDGSRTTSRGHARTWTSGSSGLRRVTCRRSSRLCAPHAAATRRAPRPPSTPHSSKSSVCMSSCGCCIRAGGGGAGCAGEGDGHRRRGARRQAGRGSRRGRGGHGGCDVAPNLSPIIPDSPWLPLGTTKSFG